MRSSSERFPYLVTGSSRRFGRAVALALAERGHPILIHYHKNRQAAEASAAACAEHGVCVELLAADLSQRSGIRSLDAQIRALGSRVQGWVHNVGPYLMAPLLETPVDAFYELFHSTVAAPFELARGLLDCLKQPGGSIVHVGMAGVDRQRVDPKRSAYTLMKATQWHLTRALARELAPLGVRCNMVSPGYMENSEDMPESFPVYSKACPVPVQDVVDTVLYLLEDASSHLTGQNLDVAGGIGL